MYTDETVEMSIQYNWDSCISEYILIKQSEGYKDGTIKNIQSTLGKFSEYCWDKGIKSPDSVQRMTVRQFMLAQQNKYSPRYVNAMLSKIRGFYSYLCLECDLPEDKDPTRRLKFTKTDTTVIVPFTDDEVMQMIQAASSQSNKFYAERDRLIIMILADCGLRVKELCLLKDSDVMDDRLLVNGKGDKQRMLYLTPTVAAQVIRYKRVRKAYMEGKGLLVSKQRFFVNFRNEPFKNDGVQKLLKRLAKKCNIRTTVRVSPHTFRHWFAQSQLKNGIDIYSLSKLLGHSSINTTQVYLSGLVEDDILQGAIKTSPLLNIRK